MADGDESLRFTVTTEEWFRIRSGGAAHGLEEAGVRHDGAGAAVDAVERLVGAAERGGHARALVHHHHVPGQRL